MFPHDMICKSGVQVARGKDDGFLCPNCRWAGRSESTRLMDLRQLVRHGREHHRLLDVQLHDFVARAEEVTRRLPGAGHAIHPTVSVVTSEIPAESNYDRALSQLRGFTSDSASGNPLVAISALPSWLYQAPSRTTHTETPSRVKSLSHAISSSPDKDHSPVKTTNSANSRQLPVDPSYKLGSPRLVGELSRSMLNDVESFCDALGENTYPTHILPPPVVKRISTEQILQAQGNIRTGGAKTMCESPVIPNANLPPRFHTLSKKTNPNIAATLQLSPASTNKFALNDTLTQVPNPHPSMTHSAQVNSNALPPSRGDMQPRASYHLESRKRKLPEDMAGRPPSRREFDRPVSRVVGTPATRATPVTTDRFVQVLPQAPNDFYHRAMLERRFPEVPIADMDYDRLKSYFYKAKDRTRFTNRAAYHYFHSTQLLMNKCREIEDSDPALGNNPTPYDIQAQNDVLRRELFSLMLQRIIQEYAVEVHQQERKEEEAAALGQTRHAQAAVRKDLSSDPTDNVLILRKLSGQSQTVDGLRGEGKSALNWEEAKAIVASELKNEALHRVAVNEQHERDRVETLLKDVVNGRQAEGTVAADEVDFSEFFDFDTAAGPDSN